jgi:hypothetical protein
VLGASDGSRALPANLCPFSRSISIGFRQTAVAYFSQNPSWKSRPKPEGDMD